MTPLAVLACLAGATLAGMRWLRVAQREHYLPGSTIRFALRWWLGPGFNRLLLFAILVNLILTAASPLFAVLVALGVGVGPFGLRLRGVAPGPLAWTRRMKTLAGVWGLLAAVPAVIGLALGSAVPAALVAVLTPAVVDVALAITRPIERRLGEPFVERATAKLRSVSPLVMAITGSYGKTTTKGYVAHLIEGTRSVVPTPRSYNNSAGIARAVNEHLTLGTEVFIAEMGTYGPGEIADLCRWVRPTVSAITAIGPVHLERMKDEETIVRAKSEIFATAEVAVINVDDPRLQPLALELVAQGKRVVRCSATDAQADVSVCAEADGVLVRRAGEVIARALGLEVPPTNVAVAVALALEAGVPNEAIAKRLATLPVAANRLAVTTGMSGAKVLDDTFNSNPAGAEAALRALGRMADGAGRVVVVTPGMIELGLRQADENRRFAARAASIATDVVVVGATNRVALVDGAVGGTSRVVAVDGMDQARAWVKENVGPGDVVLYENHLPDHFP